MAGLIVGLIIFWIGTCFCIPTTGLSYFVNPNEPEWRFVVGFSLMVIGAITALAAPFFIV
jgi:uncharacterized membrane protein